MNLKTYLALLALSLIPFCAEARMIKVAVIDTGLDLTDPRFVKHLCPSGHKDFSGAGLFDQNGHGTHVAGSIVEYAGNANYCLLIYRIYDADDDASAEVTKKALEEAVRNDADVINISGGGYEFSEREYNFLVEHPLVHLIAAAGNDGKEQRWYPCGYELKNVTCVGALGQNGKHYPLSNYGPWVNAEELGEGVESTLPLGLVGRKSGTSMATAIHSGKVVRELWIKSWSRQ